MLDLQRRVCPPGNRVKKGAEREHPAPLRLPDGRPRPSVRRSSPRSDILGTVSTGSISPFCLVLCPMPTVSTTQIAVRRQSGKIWSHLRKKWLDETPEEAVRQEFLCVLVNEYGFSPDHIAEELEVTG